MLRVRHRVEFYITSNMAMRAISSATISFGLVSIPVKMYSSYESGTTIRFNQIHSKDGSRLKQQMISAKTGEPVPKDEIVKGYEFAKGQYVLFSPDELKAIEEETTHTIDIAEFVPGNKVDRIYLVGGGIHPHGSVRSSPVRVRSSVRRSSFGSALEPR